MSACEDNTEVHHKGLGPCVSECGSVYLCVVIKCISVALEGR